MGVLMEFAVILGISLAAEVLHAYIPLPIPASIYGLIILFVLLTSGLLKVEKVRRAGSFLLEIMPVVFIPAVAGLMEIVLDMKGALLSIAAVIVLTTVIVMAVTGRTAQWLIRREAGRKHE